MLKLPFDPSAKFPLARAAVKSWPDRYRVALARGILGDILSDGMQFPAVDAPTHVRHAKEHLDAALRELEGT